MDWFPCCCPGDHGSTSSGRRHRSDCCPDGLPDVLVVTIDGVTNANYDCCDAFNTSFRLNFLESAADLAPFCTYENDPLWVAFQPNTPTYTAYWGLDLGRSVCGFRYARMALYCLGDGTRVWDFSLIPDGNCAHVYDVLGVWLNWESTVFVPCLDICEGFVFFSGNSANWCFVLDSTLTVTCEDGPPRDACVCADCCGATQLPCEFRVAMIGFNNGVATPCNGLIAATAEGVLYDPDDFTFDGHDHTEPCKWQSIYDSLGGLFTECAVVVTLTCDGGDHLIDVYLYDLAAVPTSTVHWQANIAASCDLSTVVCTFVDATGVSGACLTSLADSTATLTATG